MPAPRSLCILTLTFLFACDSTPSNAPTESPPPAAPAEPAPSEPAAEPAPAPEAAPSEPAEPTPAGENGPRVGFDRLFERGRVFKYRLSGDGTDGAEALEWDGTVECTVAETATLGTTRATRIRCVVPESEPFELVFFDDGTALYRGEPEGALDAPHFERVSTGRPELGHQPVAETFDAGRTDLSGEACTDGVEIRNVPMPGGARPAFCRLRSCVGYGSTGTDVTCFDAELGLPRLELGSREGPSDERLELIETRLAP